MIISGGTDGKVCIWQWGRDEFLHRAGEIYITNLPIQSAKVTKTCILVIQIMDQIAKCNQIEFVELDLNNIQLKFISV